MKITIAYLALIGLTGANAQSPPYKETPPGKQILDQAIAGIGKWGGPGSLQGNPNTGPKPPMTNMIGGLPELFKPKPGSSDWRDDTLKGPRKKPSALWPKNKPCRKRDGICGGIGGKGPTAGKIPSVSSGVANTLKGLGGGLAVSLGLGRLLDAIPGANDKIQEFMDDITRFQREHFGKGNTVYPLNPGKYAHCDAVKRDPHPNAAYQKELIQINCPPGTETSETQPTTTSTTPEATPEPAGQCFDSTGPIPCGGGQTEAQLDTGRAVCGICGRFWDPEGGKCRDDKAVLIWPSANTASKMPPTPSGTCFNPNGEIPCGGGQTPAELEMGYVVCGVCGFAWDPEGGQCRSKDGNIIWPQKS